MSNAPLVSIILPVYNEEHEVVRAIERLQRQTFADFEIVLVDDGSSDGTLAAARSICDPRLRVVAAQHGGLESALNCGLQVSRGEFIARQDVDDISADTRIAKQVKFLQNHPSVGVVGTCAMQVEHASGKRMPLTLPTSDAEIRRSLPWRNPFVHSSVMMRKSVIIAAGLYRTDYVWGDYELWLRLRTQTSFANLGDILIERTVRPFSHYRMKRSKSKLDDLKVQWRALADGPFSVALLASVGTSYAKFLALKAVGD